MRGIVLRCGHTPSFFTALRSVQNDGVGAALRFVVTKPPGHQVTKSSESATLL